MKTLLLATLLTPLTLFAATVNTKNSQGYDVTINTSSTGITVEERYYQDTQTTPGSYTIDGKKGTVPYVHLKQGYGFSIDDPALAKAIDGHTSKVVLTYESEPIGARYASLVTVALP